MYQYYLTCEHGGNFIPSQYQAYFKNADEILKSHKGWDIGILPVAIELSQYFNFPLMYSETSRLLVELNRSIGSTSLFSEYINNASERIKRTILQEYYLPFRDKVERDIKGYISHNFKVIHISFHSFTPIMNNTVRDGDIGLLFDPERSFEKEVCESWRYSLEDINSLFKVRYNYPYFGIDDGFTTYLRALFSNKMYAGIEIEINQKHLSSASDIQTCYETIKSSIEKLNNQFGI